jgi:outer membrane protein assembly factor BamD (BamD/ComL family)
MLGRALHALHQEHDATSALASLTAYEQRFPHGLLGEEAQAARVDALLALQRRSEALAVLDGTPFVRLARGGELRVVRGELRAASSRCREAVDDFTWALEHQPTTEMVERALYGQGVCRMKLHDPEGARANFDDYLQRFPSGRFVEAARANLKSLSQL